MNFQEITALAKRIHLENDLYPVAQCYRMSPTRFQNLVVVPKLGDAMRIEAEIKDVSGMAAYSVLLRKSDHARIRISSGITPCWQRFCYLKELCHLYLDSSQNYVLKEKVIVFTARQARKIPETVAQGCEDSSLARSSPGSLRKLDSEQAALLLALELAIPWEVKGWQLRAELLEKASPYDSMLPLAELARTPQVLLELFDEDYGVFSAGHYIP